MALPKKIVLVRHAEAAECEKASFEDDLSSLGHLQIKSISKIINSFEITHAYSSHFKRAIKTSECLEDKNIAVEIDPLLCELMKGFLDRTKLYSDEIILSEEKRREMCGQFNFRAAGGENMVDMHVRAEMFISKLQRLHSAKDVIIVFTHGWWINAALKRLTNDFNFHHQIPNCAVFEMSLVGKVYILTNFYEPTITI